MFSSGCVLGAARFRVLLFSFFFFERTHPVASMKAPCLIYLSTRNEARLAERSDQGRFCKYGIIALSQ